MMARKDPEPGCPTEEENKGHSPGEMAGDAMDESLLLLLLNDLDVSTVSPMRDLS